MKPSKTTAFKKKLHKRVNEKKSKKLITRSWKNKSSGLKRAVEIDEESRKLFRLRALVKKERDNLREVRITLENEKKLTALLQAERKALSARIRRDQDLFNAKQRKPIKKRRKERLTEETKQDSLKSLETLVKEFEFKRQEETLSDPSIF